MAWITPKTNWVATDPVNTEDYNRILGNLKYLADELRLVIQSYESQSLEDLPHAEKWNIAEDNLDTINQLTYEFEIGQKKQFRANEKYIDFEELNRLENAIAKIGLTWSVQKSCMRHLAFRLGNTRALDVPRV